MSLHFSTEELCRSDAALRLCIDNTPDAVTLAKGPK